MSVWRHPSMIVSAQRNIRGLDECVPCSNDRIIIFMVMTTKSSSLVMGIVIIIRLFEHGAHSSKPLVWAMNHYVI